METEYRIMEENGYFLVQEKIYEEYNLKELCLNLFFIVPHRYRWSIVFGKAYESLEQAKDNAIKIKSMRKYHQV